MVRSGWLVTCLLLASSTPARAIDGTRSLSEYRAGVWRLREGLPGGSVRDIAQTSDGYLWIAAVGGVGRYDGARITAVPTTAPFEAVAEPVAVFEGPQGALWIVTASGPPLCVRGDVVSECLPPGQGLPAGVRMTAATLDRAGTVWLAAREGLYRWAGGRLTVVPNTDALPLARVTTLHRDRRGRLWVGTSGGLYVETPAGFALHAGPSGPLTLSVSAIHEAPGGRLWVACAGARAFLRIENDQTTVFTEGDGLPHTRQRQVIEDRDGNVWIGSDAGLIRFRPAALPPEPRFALFTRQDGLPEDRVSAVLEDREGSLWVGTRGGGVAQFTERSLSTRGGPLSLREESIEALCQDGGGALWFGTRHGLFRYKDGQEVRYLREDGLPSNRVLSMWPGRQGELWLGTEHGVARWRAGALDVPGAFDGEIHALLPDDDGTLWMGSKSGLLTLKDGRVAEVPNEPGFAPGVVRGLQRDDRGTLWVATASALARVSDGRLVRVERADGLELRPARAVHRDAGGTLWFGTAGSGLLRRAGGRFRAFGAAEGLPDQLYQVVADDLGYLWLGTSRGILRVSRSALEEVERGQRARVEPVSFEATDGGRDVFATVVRQPGAWKGGDGRIWFATDGGPLTIDPKRVRTNVVPPPVIIERALVDGRFARQEGVTEFPPGPGNLEFQFTAPSLLEPHKVLHRYRLEGFDAGWIEAGPGRMATYTNIAAGDYRFRVQARNADGVWNEAGASIALRIRPHFYRTGWFYGLCGLAIVGLALALHRARMGRLRREYMAVFAERSRVARELHDGLLQGMAAVSMQLHAVRSQVDPKVSRKLEAIGDVVSASLEETRRFVWNLREQGGGSGDLAVALSRLARRVSDGRPVSCQVEVEGAAVDLPHDVQNELFRITQEALANALKHADARRVGVRLRYQPTGLTVTVRDDGRGFDPSRARGSEQGHFGLVGMHERAARIGASLAIDSRPGEGATVEISLPATKLSEAHA
jgi:signal transduction histidine kinase/ligand-binding sensor domain-containing protein